MAFFTFAIGTLLVAAGLGGVIASFDLLPTEVGLLYAGCGAIAISAGGVTLAIGALISRLGAIREALERAQNREGWTLAPAMPVEPPEQRVEAPAFDEPAVPTALDEPAPTEPDDRALADEDDALNENRSGHLPTMSEIEHALAEPEAAATLVGRYSAGGANYMIFSDGSIEAETEGGAFKFASMTDFKAYLAGARG